MIADGRDNLFLANREIEVMKKCCRGPDFSSRPRIGGGERVFAFQESEMRLDVARTMNNTNNFENLWQRTKKHDIKANHNTSKSGNQFGAVSPDLGMGDEDLQSFIDRIGKSL
jgi:hypothetical protein